MNDLPYNPGDILLGKYRMERLLGAGAMGIVVAATHLALNQRVAIKFMAANKVTNRQQQERFLREAQAAVQLQSQHVARVTDVGTTEQGIPYIVMELLNGKDLDGVLQERGALPYTEAVDYLLQACEAVAEAHRLRIVHRDLKPANLFLAIIAGCPCVKVLDFGVAKVLDAAKITSDGASMGSPYYMSPEQMRDGGSVDTRADIWALGVILYQLVTARMPFDSDTIGGLCTQVWFKPPAPMTSYRPDAPPGFEAVILRCLEKDREKRTQSVVEFAHAIAPYGSPASAAYPARIAAAGGASVLIAETASYAARAQTNSATTGSPIVSSDTSTRRAARPRRAVGATLAVTLGLVAACAATAVYLRVRHADPMTTPSASVAPAGADAMASVPSIIVQAPSPVPSSPTAPTVSATSASTGAFAATSAPASGTRPLAPPAPPAPRAPARPRGRATPANQDDSMYVP